MVAGAEKSEQAIQQVQRKDPTAAKAPDLPERVGCLDRRGP